VVERLLGETAAELLLQLSPQCGDNLGAVVRAFLPKDLAADAVSDLPIEQRQAGVDHAGGLLAAFEDDAADLVQHRAG
jgi:hypothetical protein